MNEEKAATPVRPTENVGKLRMPQLQRLLAAMCDAQERAASGRPVLTIDGKPWEELDRAISVLSIEDTKFLALVEKFKDVCKNNDYVWKETKLKCPNTTTVEKFHHELHDGQVAVKAVKDAYCTLAAYVELLV